MIRNFFLVGFGGALGSMLRYGTSLVIGTGIFPYATFIINITGSFIIGLIMAYSMKTESFSLNWKLFLATGLCGGFTTFSAFSLENFQLLQNEKYGMFAIYSMGSLLLGIAAAWLGFKLIFMSGGS